MLNWCHKIEDISAMAKPKSQSQQGLETASRFSFNPFTASEITDVGTSTAIDLIGKDLEETDQLTYEQIKDSIQNKIRTVKLRQDTWKLAKEINVEQGLRIEAETALVNAQTKLQNFNKAHVQLAGAKTETAIELEKLSTLDRDLRGFQSERVLKGDAWDIKLDGLRHDIQVSRQLLEQKKLTIANQLTAKQGS